MEDKIPDAVRQLELAEIGLSVTANKGEAFLFDPGMDTKQSVEFFRTLLPHAFRFINDFHSLPGEFNPTDEDSDDEDCDCDDDDCHNIPKPDIHHSLPWVLAGRRTRKLAIIGSTPTGKVLQGARGRQQASTSEFVIYIGESSVMQSARCR